MFIYYKRVLWGCFIWHETSLASCISGGGFFFRPLQDFYSDPTTSKMCLGFFFFFCSRPYMLSVHDLWYIEVIDVLKWIWLAVLKSRSGFLLQFDSKEIVVISRGLLLSCTLKCCMSCQTNLQICCQFIKWWQNQTSGNHLEMVGHGRVGGAAGWRVLAHAVGAEHCWRGQKVMDSFEEGYKKSQSGASKCPNLHCNCWNLFVPSVVRNISCMHLKICCIEHLKMKKKKKKACNLTTIT